MYRLIFRVTAPHSPQGYSDHVQTFGDRSEAVAAFDKMQLTLRIVAFALYGPGNEGIGTCGDWTGRTYPRGA
jgi:hypothetical protein